MGLIIAERARKVSISIRRTGPGVDKLIAQLNIEHFHKRLSVATDPEQRELLLRLISEEEQKLACLSADATAKNRIGKKHG